MSLFIGLLALGASAEMQNATKIGVLAGSLPFAVLGAGVLHAGKPHLLTSPDSGLL
jgi:Na+:H+ antiporter, NhaA family